MKICSLPGKTGHEYLAPVPKGRFNTYTYGVNALLCILCLFAIYFSNC